MKALLLSLVLIGCSPPSFDALGVSGQNEWHVDPALWEVWSESNQRLFDATGTLVSSRAKTCNPLRPRCAIVGEDNVYKHIFVDTNWSMQLPADAPPEQMILMLSFRLANIAETCWSKSALDAYCSTMKCAWFKPEECSSDD